MYTDSELAKDVWRTYLSTLNICVDPHSAKLPQPAVHLQAIITVMPPVCFLPSLLFLLTMCWAMLSSTPHQAFSSHSY